MNILCECSSEGRLMCKELSIFNVKELKHGDIVFIKDPETGEDVDLIVEIQKFNNKIYLTTLDSEQRYKR
jgi:hypothetical protein